MQKRKLCEAIRIERRKKKKKKKQLENELTCPWPRLARRNTPTEYPRCCHDRRQRRRRGGDFQVGLQVKARLQKSVDAADSSRQGP
jgi:hypothetical protein